MNKKERVGLGDGSLEFELKVWPIMIGFLALTRGKILLFFFFKKIKDLEGKAGKWFYFCPSVSLLKIGRQFIPTRFLKPCRIATQNINACF